MKLTQPQKLQLCNQTERILHLPGSAVRAGNPLEIAIVAELSSAREYLNETAAELAAALKRHSEIFRNVRCNVVYWGSGQELRTQAMPLSFVQSGRSLAQEKIACGDAGGGEAAAFEPPELSQLAAYLKLYHARSKCIYVVSEGRYAFGDRGKFAENMQPFLKSKLLVLLPDRIVSGAQLLAECNEAFAGSDSASGHEPHSGLPAAD